MDLKELAQLFELLGDLEVDSRDVSEKECDRIDRARKTLRKFVRKEIESWLAIDDLE